MAQKKKHISAEDLYRFQQINDARISPDGRYVILAVQRIERKTEKKYSNLWLVPTSGGAPRQFTYGDQVDSSPRWSPDGRSWPSSLIVKMQKRASLYILPFGGGEDPAVNRHQRANRRFLLVVGRQNIIVQRTEKRQSGPGTGRG
ncbi:MAG: hypothetical protein M5U34_42090 [Chloroflexi bacterium]|nr:hypothetical protein [Chloroflexota bacterium]